MVGLAWNAKGANHGIGEIDALGGLLGAFGSDARAHFTITREGLRW